MIQRIQTLWLLVAIAAAVFSIKFPFYTGTHAENPSLVELTGATNVPILILTVLNIILSGVAIFLFKNRKKQLTFIIINLILAVLILILYFLQVRNFIQGNFSLTSLFAFTVPVFLILALTGVRRDEKIIRSLDRLR